MTTNPAISITTPGQPRRVLRRIGALVEDTEWMATTGETMPGAAARLHIQPGSLRAALARAGRLDLWARLVTNADRDYFAHGVIRPTGRRAA